MLGGTTTYCTVHSESIQTHSLFPHFVKLQPYSKIEKILFYINLHTIHEKAKPGLKKKTEISHLHTYSDPLLSTLLKHLWQWLQHCNLLLWYDTTSLAHRYFGSSSHFSLQILSSAVRLAVERRCTTIFRSSLDPAATTRHCRDGAWLASSRRDAWHSDQRVQSWFHQTSESCFSWSFRCLLANSKRTVMCLLLKRDHRVLGHLPDQGPSPPIAQFGWASI